MIKSLKFSAAATRLGAAPSRTGPRRARIAGFSLVEVLVALVVTSIGLLGIAKMGTVALANTDVAGKRTIAAIEASSLAAMMHANRGYWASTAATTAARITWTGSAPSVSDTVLAATASCTAASPNSCSNSSLAAYDVQAWATTLSSLLPGYTANVACTPTVNPVTCTIQISWMEHVVAANKYQTGLAALTTATTPSYTLNVLP
jgi:type IV pilus assembly protein PilV